jgi:CRP-like cAMP-binding protein
VIRQPTRNRKAPRRPGASTSNATGSPSSASRGGLGNRLLLKLPSSDRESLLTDASYVELPAGRLFARAGDAIATAFFPDAGLLSLISEMTTGHQVAVAAVGADGMIGLPMFLGKRQYAYSAVVLVPARGYLIQSERFLRAFGNSAEVRRVSLAYAGGQMDELMRTAACNRIHSHRQRLARWLVTAAHKARQGSLPVTHETLAQMVGGPRHAVTVALNQLRTKGAIAYRRGRIDILNRSALVQESCECYSEPVEAISL